MLYRPATCSQWLCMPPVLRTSNCHWLTQEMIGSSIKSTRWLGLRQMTSGSRQYRPSGSLWAYHKERKKEISGNVATKYNVCSKRHRNWLRGYHEKVINHLNQLEDSKFTTNIVLVYYNRFSLNKRPSATRVATRLWAQITQITQWMPKKLRSRS